MPEIGPALFIQLLAGLSLAACTGLRAFLPPFVLGLAARYEVPELLLGRPLLGEGFAWLASDPALIVLGSAVVVELLADKIPAIDHALDAVQTIVRPAAGALVFAAAIGPTEPLAALVVGLVGGAPVATGVHLGKAKIRMLSTLGTGGLGSPVISVVEDVAAFVGSALAPVLAVVAALLILLGFGATFVVVRMFLRRIGRLRADLGAEPPRS